MDDGSDSPQDLRPSAASQTSSSLSGQSNGTSRRPSSGTTRTGTTSSVTLSSSRWSNQSLRPTLSTATPTSHAPGSSAQVGESPKPGRQLSPGSPASTGPASQSPGSTATTASSPQPLVDLVSSLAGQPATGTTQLDQPQSSPLPPNPPPTIASVTSQSQGSTETSPITAVSNSQTNPAVHSASASQSPRSLTANSQSSAAPAPTTGSQRPPVQPPTKITTATFPSSQPPQSLALKSASKPPPSKAAPSQSAVSAAEASQSLASVEPAGRSADSSPSGTSPVPLSPPPPGGAQSIHTPSPTASHNQSATSVPANQSLTGPATPPDPVSGVFPPDQRPVEASPLSRQAKESLKASLRRISGRLQGSTFW